MSNIKTVIVNNTTYDIEDAVARESISALEEQMPSTLADLSDDATHRLVTDTEKASWNSKASASDIPNVPSWALATTKPTYTASEVGALASTTTHLSGDIASSEKGANSGVATLGDDGKVPSSQLPSYVDDVLEYDSKSAFPTTGESGKIYIDKSTNITYRWGGSDYVSIGSDLALGETSSTAYAGNKGKANADAISALQTTVDGLPTSYAPVDAQANVIETVKVNNTALTPSSKAVNITVPTKPSDIGIVFQTTEPTTSLVSNMVWIG